VHINKSQRRISEDFMKMRRPFPKCPKPWSGQFQGNKCAFHGFQRVFARLLVRGPAKFFGSIDRLLGQVGSAALDRSGFLCGLAPGVNLPSARQVDDEAIGFLGKGIGKAGRERYEHPRPIIARLTT
jgi:hypothetical protein